MSQYRSTAELMSKKIRDSLKEELKRTDERQNRLLMAGTIGFFVGIVLIVIMGQTPLFNGFTTFLALVVPTLLSVIFLYRRDQKRNPVFQIRNDYATLQQIPLLAQSLRKAWMDAIEQKYRQQLGESEARYTEVNRQLEQSLVNELAALRVASATFIVETGTPGMPWNASAWEQWQPDETLNKVVRLGTLTTGLRTELPTIPAFIACPGEENILFKAKGNGKDKATAAIQSLMLRLLTTQPPGKVRFTLIDPVGLGQNVATFMQLTDHDERLVSSRAWTEARHIEQQLADLSEHMENVIQKYLRGQYQTIEEYNKQAGEVAEPYRILVVMGFPVNFSEEAARRLVKIATNGPRCGVSTIVMMDTEQPVPYGFNAADLERAATVIAWNGQRFVWQDKDFERCQLELDTPPELKLVNHILEEVGKEAKAASGVKVPFDRIAPAQSAWWRGSTRDGLRVSLGRAGATRLQDLDLGKGTAQHALVAGKTGSGKTTLLHVLITNLALTYSPDELELYLVDFKTVGFTPYASYKLPHARVVAIQSEREFGLSVLQGLDVELENRKNIFSKAGVQDIGQYRGLHPDVRMPRILLLVDEFQEFFTQDDKIAQNASLLLDRLIRQGRAFGIHVMLGSQTLAGAYSLARATIGQIAVRIALQCEETDSRLVLSDDNPAARLLSRPGEAIYNAANGLVEGNNQFQCSWLSDDELDAYLDRIHRFAQERRSSQPWKQITFDGSKNADVAENDRFTDMLQTPAWRTPQKAVVAWVGDPIAIKEPTAVRLHAQAGNNVLMVGQQEEVGLGMQITALLSLTAQHAPGTARFYVADLTPSDAPYAGLLSSLGQQLPHGIKVVNRRGLLNVITELADEVQRRIDDDSAAKQPMYLFIYGLQRARDLRPGEDFGFSSFGSEDAAPSPAKQFTTILREGPEVGVHTLAWCDTLANLNRTLERGALREFEVRIVQQMSQEDSMSLVDSPDASRLGPYRALLFNEESGQTEKFRPYGLPTEQWLHQAVTLIQRKQ
jgi:energy-coupling factor transporter ATP-binding protein EcfA2